MRPMIRPRGMLRTLSTFYAVCLLAALSPGRAAAAPETLVLRNARNETLYVHIDYAREPAIAAPSGWADWKAMEKDSFYVSDSGTSGEAAHVRYTHPFYAELDGRMGAGTDYVFYDHAQGEEPHYTAEIGFDFVRGDTIESWNSGNGHHMNADPRIWGYEEGVTDSTDMNFMVDMRANGADLALQDGFIDFVRRGPGWFGGGVPVALARRHGHGPARPREGWATWGSGPFLTVPEAATRLLLLDANGRRAWKADGLTPGARLEPPAGLRHGAFQCVWQP
jgi:hypothetical protein